MDNAATKRILVMMSTYNGERHLSEQIESILNQQTKHEVHLCIRDDGSRDRTCVIASEYVEKYPERVELIRGENLGYNGSFFALMHDAKNYDYYAISDQDDVWLPDKLQVACDAIDKIEENIPVLYASTSFLVHDNLVPYGITRKKEREMTIYNTIIQNICPGHTQVMNNQLLKLLKADIDARRIYVYDSWIQNVANLYGKILFDNEPHTYYRQYEGNQLGSGAGRLGQMMASISRDRNDDGHKYRRQIEYFWEKYCAELKEPGIRKELQDFIDSRTLFKRVRYAFRSKLYRQRKLETILFRCAVVINKF